MWRTIQKTLTTFVPLMILLVYLAVAVCFLNRWDSVVVVTLIPVWVWSVVGIAVSLICWIVSRGRLAIMVFCLCIATGVVFSEETHGIVRELISAISTKKTAPLDSETVLRVVNVNCFGSEAALRRAADANPDVLVIQQAPGKAILESVADQLYGVNRCVSLHQTNAIIARGELLSVLTQDDSATLHLRLKHPKGLILDITNLDLDDCAPRLDMWQPPVWKILIAARKKNRRLVRDYLGAYEINPAIIGRIISGGFGTPPGDDVYLPLEANGLIDTYAASGLGWGNTYPSEYPVLRLDQIWVSSNLRPKKSVTRLNVESGNRIVVSDMKIPEI